MQLTCAQNLPPIQPVLLAGGAGLRLAPLSTPACPKPFLPLPNGSLFARTLTRLPNGWAAPILVAHANHATHLEHVEARAILLEPVARNTAMAIAVTAAWMLQQGEGERVMAVLPADHAIKEIDVWRHAIERAADIATQKDVLVLLGIVPEVASAELGYMLSDGERVCAFREKPEDAAALLAAGWRANSGQVIARARVVAEALARHAPEIWNAAREAVQQTTPSPQPSPRRGESVTNSTLLPVHHYHPLLPIPFDRAVLEKAENIAAVECSCGWADIGTLQALAAYAMPWEGVVVAYDDAPWGRAETLVAAEGVALKRLHLLPQHRTSLQRHVHRAELWRVEQGRAEITLNEQCYQLEAGAVMAIAAGDWHRIANTGSEMLILNELQIGTPDEGDIERLEDDYGRV